MKAYIATRLENHKKHNEVRDALKDAGIGCSYDWTIHGPVYKEGFERISEVAQSELGGVEDADFVVVIFPGGRGTHVELGAAIALGKVVFLLCETDEYKQQMQAVSETCAFYHHPLCHIVYSVQHMLAYAVALKRCSGQPYNLETVMADGS